MSKEHQAPRSQGPINALANIIKMYVGIAIIAFPYTVHWVGVPIAIMGVLLLAACSILSAYMLFKARNKYKHQHIIDLPDLGFVCHGPHMRAFC